MARRTRTGTEPSTARSPQRLRLVLAGFGVVACGVATVVFLVLAGQHHGGTRTVLQVLAAAAVVGAVVAVVDAVVLVRRRVGSHHF